MCQLVYCLADSLHSNEIYSNIFRWLSKFHPSNSVESATESNIECVWKGEWVRRVEADLRSTLFGCGKAYTWPPQKKTSVRYIMQNPVKLKYFCPLTPTIRKPKRVHRTRNVCVIFCPLVAKKFLITNFLANSIVPRLCQLLYFALVPRP